MADPSNPISGVFSQNNQNIIKEEITQQVYAKDIKTESDEENNYTGLINRNRRNTFQSLKDRKPLSEKHRIQKVAEKAEDDLANSYQKRNPELPADKLKRLRQRLRPDNTVDEVLEEVYAEFSDDPTLAYEALEYLEQSSTGTLQTTIHEARDLLFSTQEREIIAGRNVDKVAKSTSRALQKQGVDRSPTDLRNLYRDITGNPRDHNTLFTELSQQYPFSQLKKLVTFLFKGMSYDLKSKGPSIQEAELMRLLTEVRNLQSIVGIYLFFQDRMRLIESLYAQQGEKIPPTVTFETLAKDFIKAARERYTSMLSLLAQMESLGVKTSAEQDIILSQYRDAIRGVSPLVYTSTHHKHDLLLAILTTLEELAIRLEEEEEGTKEVEMPKGPRKKRHEELHSTTELPKKRQKNNP